jgi:hypothetical protein
MTPEEKPDSIVELYEWSENHISADLSIDDCVRLIMWVSDKLDNHGKETYNQAIRDAAENVTLYSKGGVDVGHLLNKDSILKLLKP